MRVVWWVIVLLTIAVCAGSAALLTAMLLKVLDLAGGQRVPCQLHANDFFNVSCRSKLTASINRVVASCS